MVKLQGNSRFVDYNFSIRLFFFSNMQAGRTLCTNRALVYIPPITEEAGRFLTNQSSDTALTNDSGPIAA